MYIVRCTVVFDKSLLRICLLVDELRFVIRMSDLADDDLQQDPVVAGNDGSGGDPPGGTLYTWPDDNRPVTGGTGCRPSHRSNDPRPGTSQNPPWPTAHPVPTDEPWPVASAKGGPCPGGWGPPPVWWWRRCVGKTQDG